MDDYSNGRLLIESLVVGVLDIEFVTRVDGFSMVRGIVPRLPFHFPIVQDSFSQEVLVCASMGGIVTDSSRTDGVVWQRKTLLGSGW